VSKSGSFKDELNKKEDKVKDDGKVKSGSDPNIKSPKLSRTESMTERTVQKISKMVRGTSRSESRSKKNREPSSSPTGATVLDNDKDKATLSGQDKGVGKDDRKSAQERREMFKYNKKES